MSNAIDVHKAKTITVKEYGDFQTPLNLCNSICSIVKNENFKPTILVEPSCGKGNFIVSALEMFPTIKTVLAIEVQEFYKEELLDNLALSSVDISKIKIIFILSSFFSLDFKSIFEKNNIEPQKELFLVLGNPPWVTNSFLGTIPSNNIPIKSNKISKLKSLDALTGKSNFDISETFITVLFNYFMDKKFILAMVCKTASSHSILRNYNVNAGIFTYQSFLFDAKKHFGISASANVFVIKKSKKFDERELFCSVFNLDSPKVHLYKYGYTRKNFVSNIDLYNAYNDLEGEFPYQWRQGVKHDASSILILEKLASGLYKNKLNEIIELEDDLIFPFLKSSDIKMPIIQNSRFYILLTQQRLGENSWDKLQLYPKCWNYLQSNVHYFAKRKSKIYTNQDKFSIFGIGDYSFKPYKIVVSGFYKKLSFSLTLQIENKSVMVDDTCYTLSFDSIAEALLVWILLNSNISKEFFSSIAFLESKRPYTKDLLKRLHLRKLISKLPDLEVKKIFNSTLSTTHLITFNELLAFKGNLQ